jgi:hypothetical protein
VDAADAIAASVPRLADVERLEHEVCGAPGMRQRPPKPVHVLAVRPARESFLRERSPQAIAAQALQRLAFVRRHALRRVERETGHRSAEGLVPKTVEAGTKRPSGKMQWQ